MVFGPTMRQHFMAGNVCWRELFTSWQPGSKDRGRGGGQSYTVFFKDMPPVT